MNRLWDNGSEVLEKNWSSIVWMGILHVVLGICAITMTYVSSLFTTILLGSLILAGAVVHAVQAFHSHGWEGFFGHVVGAILYGIVGSWMILNPQLSLTALTLVIAMLLAVGGLYEIITSASLHYRSWGWSLLSGIASVCLGGLIFSQWPVSSLWVIGMFIGIDLIFRGSTAILLALAARSRAESIIELMEKGFVDRRMGAGDRRLTTAEAS